LSQTSFLTRRDTPEIAVPQQPRHPRLFFNRDELDVLRNKCRNGLRAELLKEMVDFCNRLIDPAHPDYFDFRERQKPAWKTREVVFWIRICVPRLAWTYALTGDARYGHAVRDFAMTVIHEGLADRPMEGVFGVDENGGVYQGWRRTRDHQGDPGDYAFYMCQAFDLCYDQFSPQDRREFAQHCAEGMKLALSLERIVFYQYNEVNNRGSRAQMGPLSWYGLTVGDEVDEPLFDKVFHLGVRAAESYLNASWDQDGMAFEGMTYGSGIYMIAMFGHILNRGPGPDLRRNRRFEGYLRSLLYTLLPGGGSCVDLNDADWPTGFVFPALSLMGQKGGEIIPWLIRQLEMHPSRIHLLTGGESLPIPTFLMLYWQENAAVRSPDELGFPISYCFLQRGVACMRTGWETNDVLLLHRCGMEGWNQHTQSDQNHLALYGHGEVFLIDEGYGRPQAEPGVPIRYFSQADVHNTVVIDGQDHNGNQVTGGTAEGRLIDWRHTPEFDTSLGDASSAYGRDRRIERALRRVVFVRDAMRPFAVVIDDVQCDDQGTVHQYDVLWRTHEDNRVMLEDSQFRIVGRQSNCLVRVLWPSHAALRLRMHRRRPQVVASVQGPRLVMVTLLMPIHPGAPDPLICCEQVSDQRFVVTVNDGGACVTVTAGTALHGVMHTPEVPTVIRSAIAAKPGVV
jgi:hypothetical protein